MEEDPDMKKILDSSQITKGKRQSPYLKNDSYKSIFNRHTQKVPTI